MMMLFYAALGGAIGAAARYGVNVSLPRLLGDGFPWHTFTVNVAGSFAMGLLVALMAHGWNASQEMRLFLATGILGGFTTFSAFSLDFAVLYQRKAYLEAVLYAGGSLIVSIVALFAGLAVARAVVS